MLSDADVSGLTRATDSPGCITHGHAKIGEPSVLTNTNQTNGYCKCKHIRTHQETPKPERKYIK